MSCYDIVKEDKRVQKAVQISVEQKALEEKKASVVFCDLGEDVVEIDYKKVRKLFSTYHIFSDKLKKIVEVYEDDVVFVPIFLCDAKEQEQKVYWQANFTQVDCGAKGKYESIDVLPLERKKIGGRYLWEQKFEKQSYLIVDQILAEHILRAGCIGLWFTKAREGNGCRESIKI